MAKFTATTYLETPTYSPAIPSKKFPLAVRIKSSYSFTSHSKTVQLELLDTSSGESTLLLEDDSIDSPLWLGDTKHIAWLSGKKSGNTHLVVANVEEGDVKNRHVAGTIPGPASDLKVRPLENGSLAVAFAVRVNADGKIYNPQDESKPLTSAKYYTSNMVRHWNKWNTSQKNGIFYGALETGSSGIYTLSSISSACRSEFESPIPPFGGVDNFDVGVDGIVFVARDPASDESLHTKGDCYFVQIPDYKTVPGKTVRIAVDHLEGAAGSPAISPDGKSLVFLKMKADGYESDKNRVILVQNFTGNQRVKELLQSGDGNGAWDLSPNDVWFYDNENLLLLADYQGQMPVFLLPIDTPSASLPRQLTADGSVSYAAAGTSGTLVVSGSSFTSNGFVNVVDVSGPSQSITKSPNSRHSPGRITDELWWKSESSDKVHAFIMGPSDCDKSKKYPVCVLVHGGPQGAFHDAWQSYYSVIPHIFAEAGYVVVLPQPTGSRGYGQSFMDGIRNNWGGAPYEDIRTCFKVVKDKIRYADTSRAILGGLSYGGYMTNWIQGHDFGREFKALFTLNGIFSNDMMLATEELFFPRADLCGLPWESADARANWHKWDPAQHVGNWATPHLIVHTERDFRLGIEHGIAAFNVLQAKGIESAFLKFEEEAHIVEDPENLKAMYHAILAFVNRFVGLPPPETAEGEELVLPVR